MRINEMLDENLVDFNICVVYPVIKKNKVGRHCSYKNSINFEMFVNVHSYVGILFNFQAECNTVNVKQMFISKYSF